MRSHVMINATMLNEPSMTGLGVYTLNVLRELLPLLIKDEQVTEIVLLGDQNRLSRLLGKLVESPGITVSYLAPTGPISRLLGLHRAVGRQARRGATVFYSPTHHGVLSGRVAQVVTIHDLFALLFPQNYRSQNRYFKWYVPRLLRKTQAVIADSDSTARDISRFYGSKCTVETVHAALPTDLASATPAPVSSLEDTRFFLSIGPAYAYKNADRLIDAFVQFRMRYRAEDIRLVFVGGREPYLSYLKSYIEKNAVATRNEIVFLGYVSNQELAWLYSRAVAAMVTSLYEGFGLPSLEAMHFGCPVVASNVGSLPEICGEAALFVDPYEVDDIVRAMQQVTVDRKLRSNLKVKGESNLSRFGWHITARRVYAILKNL